MKKLCKKVIIVGVGAAILVVGGACAYAGILTHIGMSDELGETAGHALFKKYFDRGRKALREL